MTLREALVSFNLRTSHPEILANLEIKNYDKFCRYSLLNYFQSLNFRNDMESCVLDIQEGYEHGYDGFFLYFAKNSYDKLELKVDLIEFFKDSIESYEV